MSYPQEAPPKYEEGPGYPPGSGYPAGPPPAQPAGYAPPPAGYQQPTGCPTQPGMGYPTQPGTGYPAQPGTGYPTNQATIIVNQPLNGPRDGSTIRYTQSPALIVCQHCRATVTTSMEYETGLLTWAVCGGLCIFGCCLGCCLIPFCIDGTKDARHNCPNCQKIVGHFRHFS